MRDFNYHRPAVLAEAQRLFSAASEARYLAGGQTLIPTLKQRLTSPSDVIDLGEIRELKGISATNTDLLLGAATRHFEVATSDIVRRAIPALAALAGGIGDPHVRHLGTIGGSIANNDPAADYPAAVLGLGAQVHTTSRAIKAEDFFKGLFETALNPGEVITKISFPIPEKAAYAKFPNPASRYAMVGVFVAKSAGAVRVAVTGAGAGVFRLPQLEAALTKSFSAAALSGLTVPAEGLTSDLHGSAEYRAHLITVMARRAVSTIS